jgi:hypothetical protein
VWKVKKRRSQRVASSSGDNGVGGDDEKEEDEEEKLEEKEEETKMADARDIHVWTEDGDDDDDDDENMYSAKNIQAKYMHGKRYGQLLLVHVPDL